ncbi:MAG TPA: ATP-dependent Clp protease ATP-binding subunit [Pseudonocardia sp.]|jgi:ATP-dependent Clp protease ATP-binding subunit ClpC|nr:ATP-dependent Clp protease ATP-binding subunit [Pseudonocardia sp.]
MPEQPYQGGFGPLDDLVGKLFAGLEQAFVDQEPDRRDEPDAPPRRRTSTRQLDRHGRDLTAAARGGRLDPVIGRDDEIDQVLEILARRTKNNPVLVGDPGVGKTAIVEGIAQRVVDGTVPAALREVRVVSLDLAGMVAGTRYRGDFEQRLTAVIDEVVAAERSVVLFVDELHAVVGAGAAEGGAMDAGTILKPALARGELQLIGATTTAEYRRHIERDAALERRFEPVRVAEPSVEQTVAVLRGLRDRYQAHHGVTIADAALEAAAVLSHRYVRDRFLPDKAIDLVDRASARARLRAVSAVSGTDERITQLTRARDVAVDAEDYERAQVLTRELDRVVAERAPAGGATPEVTADDIAEAVSRSTGIPTARLTAADRDRLLHLEDHLRARVVGQDEAVEAVADAVRQGRTGLAHPDRPVGSFLFLGPTGVGKTELARALSDALSGGEPVRFDMGEFTDASSLTRLVGAPPGYVGHGEPGQLTEAVRRNPYGVLLFDEIEKAHRDVTGTLLQVLDAGRLTDAHGRTADFTHTVIVLTGNLGADQLLAAAAAGRPPEDVREPLLALARARLRPEFVNRLDEVVLFRALGAGELRRITALLLEQTRDRLRAQDVELVVSDAAVGWLAERDARPEHGARPLRRTIARELDRRLSRLLLAGGLRAGQRVTVDVAAGGDALELVAR